MTRVRIPGRPVIAGLALALALVLAAHFLRRRDA